MVPLEFQREERLRSPPRQMVAVDTWEMSDCIFAECIEVAKVSVTTPYSAQTETTHPLQGRAGDTAQAAARIPLERTKLSQL